MSDGDEDNVAVATNEGNRAANSSASKKFTRLACNRCHSHKLRCKKPNGSSEDCERCIRANTYCVYGMPMRLGRPRFSGNVNEQAASSNNSNTTNITTTSGEELEDNSSSSSSAYSTQGKTRIRKSGDVHNHRDPVIPYASELRSWTHAKQRSQPAKRKLQDTNFVVVNTEKPTSVWSDARNADTDMMDDEDMLGGVGAGDQAINTDQAGTAPHPIYEDQQDLNLFTNFTSWPTDPVPTASDHFIDSIQSFSPLLPGSFDNIHWPSEDYLRNFYGASGLDKPMSSLEMPQYHQSGDISASTMKNCIQELSDLQIMLYRCSTTPPNENGQQQSRVVDVHMNANLGNVTFLAPATNVSDTEADTIFKVAQTFIDILKRLAAHAPPADAADRHFDNSRPPPLMGLPFSDAASSEQSSPSDETSLTSEHNVMFFLVLTCYLRLLNICDPFVADLRVRLQTSNISAHSSASDLPGLRLGSFTPPASSELHIVLLVHVIQHLLDRVDKGIMACFPVELAMNVNQAGPAYGQQGQEDSQSRRIHLVANQFTLSEIKVREEILRKGFARVTDLLKGSALL
ncbi:uncharacterized protein RCO7_02367 [Rhynchosporium graminicola]|uniref:Zn(2)-C6 fungal-type domain-containing protein n=1 Tax=Rhynchosporium graminicola TaxID=2792576 RepID=A0A1E1JVQ3_9HELO|nr:uncharacterized protein RCO7_02367 [Rhynchosporium commune]